MSEVSFIDSTGIGVLVGALKRTRENRGSFALVGAQPRVRRVFEITGLLQALPLFDSIDEALTVDSPTAGAKETHDD
jgi:anti-sigma B factor antagonist